jgi:hypothetical protein
MQWRDASFEVEKPRRHGPFLTMNGKNGPQPFRMAAVVQMMEGYEDVDSGKGEKGTILRLIHGGMFFVYHPIVDVLNAMRGFYAKEPFGSLTDNDEDIPDVVSYSPVPKPRKPRKPRKLAG